MIRDIRVLYVREVRTALRERTVVVNGILIPVFLYPVLLWTIFSAFLFVEGLAEGFDARVAAPDWERAPELHEALAETEQIEMVRDVDAAEARSRLVAGDVDVIVHVEPVGARGGALEGNHALRLLYDGAEERSRRARARVEGVADSLRGVRLAHEARRLGIDSDALRAFHVEMENVSSGRDTGRRLLAVMVPIFLTVMVALGCFIPAVDTTAGERERSTWETLWTTGPSRTSVVLSKYLFVATMGIVAGVLNVVAVSVSLGGIFRPLFEERSASLAFALPPAAIPLMLAGAVLLALLFAATMMLLAVFARTFKEGQAMVMPAYWLALTPILVGGSAERTLTPALALVPVANVALAARDAIQTRVDMGLVVLAFAVDIALVIACLWLAARIVEREEVVTGAFEGSLWSWLRSRRRRARV